MSTEARTVKQCIPFLGTFFTVDSHPYRVMITHRITHSMDHLERQNQGIELEKDE